MLYPPQEQRCMAKLMPRGRYVNLRSSYGHDGFLIEAEALNREIGRFRNRLEESRVQRSRTEAVHPVLPFAC